MRWHLGDRSMKISAVFLQQRARLKLHAFSRLIIRTPSASCTLAYVVEVLALAQICSLRSREGGTQEYLFAQLHHGACLHVLSL